MNVQAPLQVENLLPYDIRYLVYDKTTKQDHRDVLKKGEIDSIHIVDPSHVLALSVQILGTGMPLYFLVNWFDVDFKPSDVALISNSGKELNVEMLKAAEIDFRDDSIEMKDSSGRQLILGLKYW